MSGSILIQQGPAYVLFDCGATYSFTSKRFYKKIRHKPEKLEEPFQVATPACKTIETSEIHRDCRISIGDQTFSADLIPLVVVDFDIIHGMDWLSRNNTTIDCKGKSVKTPNPETR